MREVRGSDGAVARVYRADDGVLLYLGSQDHAFAVFGVFGRAQVLALISWLVEGAGGITVSGVDSDIGSKRS